jgi:hypothetical protein
VSVARSRPAGRPVPVRRFGHSESVSDVHAGTQLASQLQSQLTTVTRAYEYFTIMTTQYSDLTSRPSGESSRVVDVESDSALVTRDCAAALRARQAAPAAQLGDSSLAAPMATPPGRPSGLTDNFQ